MAMRWYVVHVYSGFEKKVAQSIREQSETKGLAEEFEQVLVKMELTDETWHLVKNTPKVTNFLGGGGRGRPVPITETEAQRIIRQVQEGIERPKPSITFEVGEQARLKVAVSIFGRATPVELEYSQVEKM